MDIKSKNYLHNKFIKFLCFLIITVSTSFFFKEFYKVIQIYENKNNFDILFIDDFKDSYNFKSSVDTLIDDLFKLNIEYRNEDYIKEGNLITENRVNDYFKNLFYTYEKNSSNIDYDINRNDRFNNYKKNNLDKYEYIKKKLIQDDLNTYNDKLNALNQLFTIDIYFDIKLDGKSQIYTNSTHKEKLKEYSIYSNFEYYITPNGEPKDVGMPFNYMPKTEYDSILNKYKVKYRLENIEYIDMYLCFSSDYLRLYKSEFEDDKNDLINIACNLSISFFIAILFFIYLCIIIGKNNFKDKDIKLNFFDNLYNDIKLFIIIGLLSLFVVSYYYIYYMKNYSNKLNLAFVLTFIFSALVLSFILSLVKNIKSKKLLKNSLIFKCIEFFYIKLIKKFIIDIIKSFFITIKDSLFSNLKFNKKITLILFLYIIFYCFYILFALAVYSIELLIISPIFIIIPSIFIIYKLKNYKYIKLGLKEIENGNLNHKINIDNNGEFLELASSINNISDGFNKALKDKMKSEKLKTDLITNVSHDIKTPLTSIITYVDLLKKEDDNDKQKKYISILDKKSKRLKILIDDLFEASKASSGNIDIDIKNLDLVQLLNQLIAEVEDKIKENKLTIKLNSPNDKINIKADGNLLSRIFENIFSNVFKYSLKNTRVYIDIEEENNYYKISIKNTSAYELNICEDELMQRFKRGDKSRNTSGHGLGLSIATSLSQLQNIKFYIKIDGDLFKSILEIKK